MTEGVDGRPAGSCPGRRRLTLVERRRRRGAVDDPDVVLAAAARYLEVRSRSVHETRRHLLEAGYRVELVTRAIDRLVELGILDDVSFAEAWVASRDRARPRGERALRRELALKGIADETIRAALAARATGVAGHLGAPGAPGTPGTPWAPPPGVGATVAADEAEATGDAEEAVDERAAARLLDKRAASLARVGDPRLRRQRAYALLARNGFDPDVASRVAERFVRELSG